ncbi:MAG: hypothetical protein IT450_00810 [Phycisphaerales bacterium]|nr:hypothetical protein [Phycisphaerales bacterium]
MGESLRIPPRNRWFLRIAAAYVLLIAGLVCLWYWWDAHTRAGLEAKIAALKAAGEPTRIEDFALASVADEVNAEHALALGAPLIVEYFDYSVPGIDGVFCWNLALCRELPDLHDAFIAANREALCRLRDARELHEASQSPQGPTLSQYRQYAKLAAAAANFAHVRLDDAAAIEYLRDGLALSRILTEARPPSLISMLVGIAMDALVCQSAREIAAEMDIVDAAPNGAAGPASRASVERLIVELLDESSLTGRYLDAIRAELVQSAGWLAGTPGVGGLGGPAPPGWLFLRPSLQFETGAILDYLAGMRDAIAAPTLPEARRRMPPLPFREGRVGGVEAVATFGRRLVVFDMRTIFVSCYEHIATRRATAIALAIRLYELDHGRRPAQLEDLVPRYLAVIPDDPFADGSQPMRYRTGDEACLHSIGANGIDDGGVVQPDRRDEIIFPLDTAPDWKLLRQFPGLLERIPDEP